MSVVISGTGLFTPAEYITNEELVQSFNNYVAKYNEDNKELICSGDLEALVPSSSEFIKKASGIEQSRRKIRLRAERGSNHPRVQYHATAPYI